MQGRIYCLSYRSNCNHDKNTFSIIENNGYYPQKAASKDMQKRLEIEYKSGRISKTENGYTIIMPID